MVALVALFMGLLTFVEYNSVYPSLVEFRDAPPFNRIRFLMLFATVFSLSAIQRGMFIPSTLTQFMDAVGTLMGLDCIQVLLGRHDPEIVPVVLGGQLGRKQIKVRFAEDFPQRAADGLAEPLVGKRKSPLDILPQNVLGQRFNERLIKTFRGAEPGFEGFQVRLFVVGFGRVHSVVSCRSRGRRQEPSFGS